MRADTGDGVYISPSNLDVAALSDIGWKRTPLAATPEPSQYAGLGLGALGLLGLGFKARRRKATADA